MAHSFGELVLVVGDLHIPHRAPGIPDKFQRILVPNKMQHLLCVGNVMSKKELEILRMLSPDVHIVAGDFDDDIETIPETKTVRIGDFVIGLIHGHQVVPWGDASALDTIRYQLGCDILISGHTHRHELQERKGGWSLNPGSMTGAFSHTETPGDGIVPSFMLLAIRGPHCVAYVYELINDKVKVSKTEFAKSAPNDG